MSIFNFFRKKGRKMKAEKLLVTTKDEQGKEVDVEDWQGTTVQVAGTEGGKPFQGQVDVEASIDGMNYAIIRTFTSEGFQTLDGTYSRVRATSLKMTGGEVTILVAGR